MSRNYVGKRSDLYCGVICNRWIGGRFAPVLVWIRFVNYVREVDGFMTRQYRMEDAILELFREKYNEERKGGSGCRFIYKDGSVREEAEKWVQRTCPGQAFAETYELQIDFDEEYDVTTHAQHYA